MSRTHSHTLDKLDSYWGQLLNALALLACLMIFIMMTVICADVAIRAMQKGNLPWAPEIAEYTLYLATFFAAPWLLREGKHVRMDMLLKSIPKKSAWFIEICADVIGVATSLMLAFSSVKAVIASADQGSFILKILVFPEWWTLVPAACVFAILAIEFLFRLRRLLASEKTPREEATSAA